MFICEECVKNYVTNRPPETYRKSYGNCEDCRKICVCYDVPHNQYYHKESEYAKKLNTKKRTLELLAYAQICFDKCTSPFALTHLQKNNVSSDECIDLSHKIADLIENEMYSYPDRDNNIHYLLAIAEKKFMETQK